jgi:hypothetical protein
MPAMMNYQTNTRARPDYNPRLLASVVLTATDDRIYIVPAGYTAEIQTIVVCNTHTTLATLRMHHTRPGVASGVSNAQYYDARLANGTTLVDDVRRPMTPNEQLRGRASVAAVVCVSVYGRETALPA